MNTFEYFFNKELEKYKEFNLFNTYFQSTFPNKKITMIGENILNINSLY